MPQMNPKTTNVALNGDAGAYVIIRCSIAASKVVIQEDPAQNAGTPQGLQGYYLDPDVLAQTAAAPSVDPAAPNQQVWEPNTAGQTGPAYQPITFGGDPGRVHGAFGNLVGANGNNNLGTPLLLLRSNSGTATGVIVQEWP